MKFSNVSKKAVAAALVCALTVAVPASLTASANSAPKRWSGEYSTGALASDENCPVVVESELLTFDIADFPSVSYYDDVKAEEFYSYGAKVTARYTFYNPADYAVNMTLAFPFGSLPDYFHLYDDEEERWLYPDDTSKYAITADGAEVERTIRYTYSDFESFETKTDLKKLCDDFKSYGQLSPQTTVYKYVFLMENVACEDNNSNAWVSAEFDGEERYVFTGNSGYTALYGGGAKLGWWVKSGKEVVIYSTDKSPEKLVWKFYLTGSEKTATEGSASLISSEQTTFKDLVLGTMEEGTAVSQSDYYNAVVDRLSASDERYFSEYELHLYAENLMRWYEYTLNIQPHARVINEVSAPIYPDVNGYYEPWVYDYTYLLSPAQSWADFGTIEVRVNTPFYIVKNSIKGFEKTDYGYKYMTDGLPKGELEFRLCSSPDPQREIAAWGWLGIIICVLGLLPILIPVVTLIILLVRRKKNKKQSVDGEQTSYGAQSCDGTQGPDGAGGR